MDVTSGADVISDVAIGISIRSHTIYLPLNVVVTSAVVFIGVLEMVGDVVVTSAVVFIGVLELVITGDVVVTDGCCHRCIGCCHRWWCCYRIIDNTYHNIYHYLPLKTNDFQHVGDIKFNYKVLSDMSESIKMRNLACHKKCIDNPIRLKDDEAILIFKFMLPYKIVSCIKLLTCGRYL